MAPKASWHRYGTKLRHCHPTYSHSSIHAAMNRIWHLVFRRRRGRPYIGACVCEIGFSMAHRAVVWRHPRNACVQLFSRAICRCAGVRATELSARISIIVSDRLLSQFCCPVLMCIDRQLRKDRIWETDRSKLNFDKFKSSLANIHLLWRWVACLTFQLPHVTTGSIQKQ